MLQDDSEFYQDGLLEMLDLCTDIRNLFFHTQFENINQDFINTLFRYIHGVKGTAMALSINDIVEVTHKVEDYLCQVRDDRDTLTQELYNLILECNDQLEDFFNLSLKGNKTLPSFEQLIYKLNMAIDQKNHHQETNVETLPKQEVIKKINHTLLANKRVLIIDDEKDLVTLMKSLLEDVLIDSQIDLTYDGQEGLKQAESNSYDIIFCDYNMPNLNGIQVLKKIRLIENQINKETPVIFVTAYKPELETNSDLWDSVYFLDKPFAFKKLSYFTKLALTSKVFKKAN
jgi:CheY-like chemotaxis protein